MVRFAAGLFCAPVLVLFTLLGLAADCSAQEFRVYTRLFDENPPTTRPGTQPESELKVRSLTLFHTGKVYDYIASVDEVIIFEPAHERFTILSVKRSLATSIKLAELDRMVQKAETRMRGEIDHLRDDPSPELRTLGESLAFALNPNFDGSFDAETKTISLTSGPLRYRAVGAEIDRPEAIDRYLSYADWIARLNHALHPRSMPPRPRMVLNGWLRKHGLMPTEVELKADMGHPVHMRATHQIHWELDGKDRSLIHHWESLLRSSQTKRISFREYQKLCEQ